MSELSIKKPVGKVVAVVCAGLALSAAVQIPMCLLRHQYYMLGFEVVALVGAIIGILTATGRYAQGPGMALLCVMASVGIGSLLGEVSTYDPLTKQSMNPTAGPVVAIIRVGGVIEAPLTTFLAARLAAAAVVGACGAWVVLSRRPKESFPNLLRGLGLGGVFVLILGLCWVLRAQIGGMGTVGRVAVEVVGAAVALALFSAAVHYTVRAFERGRLNGGAAAPK